MNKITKKEFTAKEREVVDKIYQGKGNTQIAKELGVTLNTAKTHVRHILAKTETPGKVTLIIKLMRDGYFGCICVCHKEEK